MSFQSLVRLAQTNGIIGEIIYDGPHRLRPLNVNSNGGTPNTVGKAFTYDSAVDGEAGPGTVGGGAFAGILAIPKSYALNGTVAGGSLAPTLDLPDYTNAELLSMGTMIVDLTIVDTGKIGEGIFFVDATGALGSGTAAAGQTQITNAKIDRENISGAGLAIITLTEPA